MDQQMLTYLKVALWLADRSPELSHIPLLSVLSLVCLAVPFASWLRGAVPSACPCALALAGWVALGLAVPVGGCGVGLGLLPLPCFPLYASSSAAYLLLVCVRPLPRPGLLPCGLGCWGWPGLCSPLPLAPLCLVALPRTVSLVRVWRPGSGCGVRGVPLVAEGGVVLTPGHE